MRALIITILFFFGLQALGQTYPLTFANRGKPIIIMGRDTFYSQKVHEITLNPDSTYAFWSRPHVSCFTWHQYKGTWKKEMDTVFFYDNYEIKENDTRVIYKKDLRKSFFISFKTDRNAELKNKIVNVQFVYDYNAQLEDSAAVISLGANNTIEIPFDKIQSLIQLASIRIEYQLNAGEKRYSHLTENTTVNIKEKEIPNIINVEFVENPKKETVYRIIKAVIQKDTLAIVSSSKTKTTLQDYNRDIEFEGSYTLNK